MRDKLSEYIKGFYFITDFEYSNGKTNFETVEQMINAGAKVIQYREKNKTMSQKYQEALNIKNLCNQNDCIFIINDHVDLALAVDADGVHIGQGDLPVSVVREILGPDKIIGLSTHNQSDAVNSNLLDIDYVGVGPIFDTPKKSYAIGFEYLDYALENIKVPKVVIGGIKEKHLKALIERGCQTICMVSEITLKDDIPAYINKIKKELNW